MRGRDADVALPWNEVLDLLAAELRRVKDRHGAGASGLMLTHILGSMEEVARRNLTWEQIVAHTDVVLAFRRHGAEEFAHRLR